MPQRSRPDAGWTRRAGAPLPAAAHRLSTAGPGSTSSTTSPFSAGWPRDLARDADAGDHRLHVVVAAQEVETDLRRRQRIGALQPHRAASLRAQMHRTDRECRERMRDDALARAVDRAPGGNVHLQVRPLEAMVAAYQRADIEPVARHRPAAPEQVLRAGQQLMRDAVMQHVQRQRARDAPGAVGVEVIVQVGPDARQVVQHGDAHVLQMLAPDRCPTAAEAAANHRRRRRRSPRRARARSQPARRAELDADRAAVLDQHARRVRVGLDHEVRPLARGRR